MATVNDKMTAINDAIREKTGGTEPLTLDGMAESIPEVYEAGKSAMWDNVQNYGNRKSYNNGFLGWGGKEIKPKHKVEPTDIASQLFSECESLESIDPNLFDLSKAKYHASDKTKTTTYRLCYRCGKLKVFPDIGLQAGYYDGTFFACHELEIIKILRVKDDTEFGASCFRSNGLREIEEIEGTICSSIWINQAPSLSPETQKRIIKRLKIYKQTELEYEYTITFNPTAFAVLEAEGISEEDWEWVAEQFPNANIELVKSVVEDSWEMLIGLCIGWNVTVG